MIIGAGDWEKSTAQLEKIYHGLAWFGTGTTGWVAATDVSDIIVQSIQMETNGERYISVLKTNLTKKFCNACKTLNKQPPKPNHRFLQPKTMAFVEFIGSALQIPLLSLLKETIG